jgi:hypothetical protein
LVVHEVPAARPAEVDRLTNYKFMFTTDPFFCRGAQHDRIIGGFGPIFGIVTALLLRGSAAA